MFERAMHQGGFGLLLFEVRTELSLCHLVFPQLQNPQRRLRTDRAPGPGWPRWTPGESDIAAKWRSTWTQ